MIESRSRKPLTWFIALAFGSSWLLYLLPLAFGAPGSQPWEHVRALSWSVAMWGPGLAAIITTRLIGRGSNLSSPNTHRFGPKRIYLLAWLLPPLLALVTGVLTWMLRVGQPDLTFPTIRQDISQLPEGKSETLVQVAVGVLIVTMLTLDL